MNVWFPFHRQRIHCLRWLSLLLVAATASSFASSACGQRLTLPPFMFPVPNSQAPPTSQIQPSRSARRVQVRPVAKRTVTKRVVTKAQLNQALIAEAYHRKTAHVAGLLTQGADPNARDKAGTSALFYAAVVKDNVPVVTLLLSKGANVNARDPHGNTPLVEAIEIADDPLAALLLDRKADPNALNGAGFMPLGIATAKNDAPMIKLLLTHGADPNAAQHGPDLAGTSARGRRPRSAPCGADQFGAASGCLARFSGRGGSGSAACRSGGRTN